MKNIKKIIGIAFFVLSVVGCGNDKNDISIWDSGALEEFKVTPTFGGGEIEYTIPDDPNILYIMAEYERNGQEFNEKSSIYGNSIKIEGFNNTELVKVKLYKVNRKGQLSEAKEIEFTPLNSLIQIAEKSLIMEATFGGIGVSWENPEKTELGVRLLVVNEVGEVETKEMYFSTLPYENKYFRGFEAEETTFGISFEDKWGNVSDTSWLKTTPLFEKLISKPYHDFRFEIPYDNITSQEGEKYNIDKVWDGIVHTEFNGYRTLAGSSGQSFTIDLGVVAKLSRVVFHPYHVRSMYGYENLNAVEIWGIKKIDYDKLTDKPYWLDEESLRRGAVHEVNSSVVLPEETFKDDWEYLGYYEYPRFDLMDPPDRQAELDMAISGIPFTLPEDIGDVRFIRLFVRGASKVIPTPLDNRWAVGEITFYGDDSVPQD